jgi:polysaccharide biosynthesis/export protein
MTGKPRQPLLALFAALAACAVAPQFLLSQTEPATRSRRQSEPARAEAKTAEEYNLRLEQLRRSLESQALPVPAEEYRIGPEDLLEIGVFEAPEMNRSLRISAGGEISLPLLGAVQAAGLTPRELEFVLQELLRRSVMKDPHVSVFVREMQSHAVSVFGAVRKPGVFQIRGAKTLVEVLAMAEGLSEDAGDTVLVMRGAGFRGTGQTNLAGPVASPVALPTGEELGPAAATAAAPAEPAGDGTIEIELKRLLDSGDEGSNVPVYPGDLVKVTRAGIVYVVGEVRKPGGFVLKSNENISVLQALALAEGLTRTSQRSRTRIIHIEEDTGQRRERIVDLARILAGKAEDPILRPKDIVFVPNSAARSGMYRGAEAAISVVSGLLIFRK